MCVILLLFLMKGAWATSSIYVVTSNGHGNVNGIYKELHNDNYQKNGEADSNGHYQFLYEDSRRPKTWILGFGRTLSTATALYRAPATETGSPAFTD